MQIPWIHNLWNTMANISATWFETPFVSLLSITMIADIVVVGINLKLIIQDIVSHIQYYENSQISIDIKNT